jgi:hypothetical protein
VDGRYKSNRRDAIEDDDPLLWLSAMNLTLVEEGIESLEFLEL